jgi:RNA polymerase sigma-70 factor, ECF subfamily
MQATMQIAQANPMANSQYESGAEPVRDGLEQIFGENKDLVYRAAYRITGNGNDAEDVLQTVFLRLLRQENPPEIRHVRAYLHRAAVNAALDLLRARKDNQNVPLEDDEPGNMGTGAVMTGPEAGELRAWLRQALTRVNPKWAEMFLLRFTEDYSNGEIARMMKTSSAVVAVILHRTRAQLRKDYLAVMRGTK